MRLPEVLRTTSFRLTLLYGAIFCVSVLLLFGAIYWYGTGYIANQIDLTVANEITEIENNLHTYSRRGMEEAVTRYTNQAPAGVFYLLQDAEGRVLAGNMQPADPIAGIRTLSGSYGRVHYPGSEHGIRGRGVRYADGSYFFVGLDDHELNEMSELVTRAFGWGLLAMLLLALGGGTLMSAGLLRYIETMAATSGEIVGGDLSRRIPLRGTNDEFDHLAASFNAALDRISGLMEGLRQVSTDIAHDLRTPLTRLRQRLELARRRAGTVEELHAALDSSLADVDAILETFAALLRIAQIEAHTKAVAFADLDLSQLLRDMAETYQSVAEDNGQSLESRIAAGLMISADRELLPQLFSNLIENSLRHSPTGSRTRIVAERAGDGIVVTISDNGPGIPAEMREKVFQRFFRLEDSRTTEGTGLGLSLAAAIAGLHGARIALSDAAPGLCATVVFPDRSV